VFGRGYYVTGPAPDAPGRPSRDKPSFHVLPSQPQGKCLRQRRLLDRVPMGADGGRARAAPGPAGRAPGRAGQPGGHRRRGPLTGRTPPALFMSRTDRVRRPGAGAQLVVGTKTWPFQRHETMR
jgi:hypothetical protein